MLIHCAACGTDVHLAPSQVARRKNTACITCSVRCSSLIRRDPVLGWKRPDFRTAKPCEHCGASMMVKRCSLTRKKYCSRQCLGRATVARLNVNRKPQVWSASSRAAARVRFSGRNNPKWVKPILFTCPQCQQPFGLKPFEVKRRTEHCGYPPKFCSRACHLAHKRAHTGPQSPVWRGGNPTYRGPRWRVLRLGVIAAQDGCCATCGKFRGTRLHVHHRRLYSDHATAAEANHPENLVGLCESCHGKMDGRPDRLRRINAGRRAV